MKVRSVRASAAVAVTALTSSLLAIASPAQAYVIETDDTLCPGTSVWIGGFDDGDAGQPVTGLTTSSGTTPEEFEGEYISTIADPFGNDVFLFDLSGSRITKADGSVDAGIWSGMSGSPVYDDEGNLIGAVAYSFAGDTASTIAGVTPAQNLLAMRDGDELASRITLTKAERAEVEDATDAPIGRTLQQMTGERVIASSLGTTGKGGANADRGYFTKKSRALNLKGTFGTAGTAEGIDTIEPGGNIATSWSSGDLLMAAVGTVTAVCDDEVFAFGHPDEDIGRSSQSFHSAKTVTVVADGAYSYKITNINLVPAGRLVFDGSNGVYGRLGDGPAGARVTTQSSFGEAVTSHETTVSEPLAVSTAVANQVYGELSALLRNGTGPADVELSWTIDYVADDGVPSTTGRSQRYTSHDFTAAIAATDVAGDVETLQYYTDEDVRITGVHVTSSVVSSRYSRLRPVAVQYRTGKTTPSGDWTTVKKSDVVVKKGHKVEYRAVLKPAPGATGATAYSPSIVKTTSTKWGSSGDLRIADALTASWDELEDEEYYDDEYYGEDYEEYYEEDTIPLEELLDLFETYPTSTQYGHRLKYKVKSTTYGTTYSWFDVDAPAPIDGRLVVPVTYKK